MPWALAGVKCPSQYLLVTAAEAPFGLHGVELKALLFQQL